MANLCCSGLQPGVLPQEQVALLLRLTVFFDPKCLQQTIGREKLQNIPRANE